MAACKAVEVTTIEITSSLLVGAGLPSGFSLLGGGTGEEMLVWAKVSGIF
jgi:hypothetical protein